MRPACPEYYVGQDEARARLMLPLSAMTAEQVIASVSWHMVHADALFDQCKTSIALAEAFEAGEQHGASESDVAAAVARLRKAGEAGERAADLLDLVSAAIPAWTAKHEGLGLAEAVHLLWPR